jgi:hypothetical protein
LPRGTCSLDSLRRATLAPVCTLVIDLESLL